MLSTYVRVARELFDQKLDEVLVIQPLFSVRSHSYKMVL